MGGRPSGKVGTDGINHWQLVATRPKDKKAISI
jgi:hypothetical protein